MVIQMERSINGRFIIQSEDKLPPYICDNVEQVSMFLTRYYESGSFVVAAEAVDHAKGEPAGQK